MEVEVFDREGSPVVRSTETSLSLPMRLLILLFALGAAGIILFLAAGGTLAKKAKALLPKKNRNPE